MKFTNDQDAQINLRLCSLAKKYSRTLSLRQWCGSPISKKDGTYVSITDEDHGLIIHEEDRDDFTFDEYMRFIDSAEKKLKDREIISQ